LVLPAELIRGNCCGVLDFKGPIGEDGQPVGPAGGDSLFQSSVAATSPFLVDAILTDRAFEIEDHRNCLESARRE
jgi:hypothetical protein